MRTTYGPFRLRANETDDLCWFVDQNGAPLQFGSEPLSVQVLSDNTWDTAVYQIVACVADPCPPVGIPGVKLITPSSAYAMQFTANSFYKVGLKNTTVEGGALDLFAYLSAGV